jgi:hypothetical protein
VNNLEEASLFTEDIMETIPKGGFLRGGFDRKDKRRPSMIVGICIGEGND